MTDEKRCEPPEHLRGSDGEHFVCGPNGVPFVALWHAAPHAGIEPLWHNAARTSTGTPAWAANQWGWRYVAPVTAPAVVAALVAALEDISVLSDQSAVLDLAWNALARAKETGIDMTDEKRSEPWLEDDTDGAPAEIVMAALARCFLSSRPDARVLGNVRAGDALRAIREMWGKANAHTTPPATVAALVEALDDLLADTQHATHDCGDDDCPVRRAHAALNLYLEAE